MTKAHADHVRYKGPDHVVWNVTDPLGRPWSRDYDPWDGLITVLIFGSIFVFVIGCLLLKALWRLVYKECLNPCCRKSGLIKWYWRLLDKDDAPNLGINEQLATADVAEQLLSYRNQGSSSDLDSVSFVMHNLDNVSEESIFVESSESCLLEESRPGVTTVPLDVYQRHSQQACMQQTEQHIIATETDSHRIATAHENSTIPV